MKRFLDLADFEREEILDLLALAESLRNKPQRQALAGKVLGLLFMNPSLRTLASFQTAMAHLGGSSFVITPGQGTWQIETRLNAVMDGAAAEHIREGIPVLASYGDALGVRAFADGKNLQDDLSESLFRQIDALCEAPLINLESAVNHPCQALADWRTLDELNTPTRAKFVLSWVYHPRALPLAVASATVHMAAMRGMDVVGGAARGVRASGRDHGQGTARGGRGGRLRYGDLGPRGGAQGRARGVRQGMGLARRITATQRRMRACAPNSRIGAWASAGSPERRPMPGSCTACPCAATSR